MSMTTIDQSLLQQAGHYKPRTADEQRILVQRAQDGDKDARDQLVVCNLRLVINCMKSYPQFMAAHFDDLYQAGIVGLLKAINHYDSAFGTKFSSYATHWINQSMRMWIFDQNTIYVPRYLHDAAIKINQTMRQGCHSGDVQELVDRTGLKPSHVEHGIQHLARSYISLDTPSYEADYTYQEIIPDIEEDPYAALAEQDEARWIAEPLLAILPSRERHAIELRFGFAQGKEMTYPEIAQALHLSTYCVFHLVRRAIEKMRIAAGVLAQEAQAS